jgi:hypothetical protein
MYRALEVLKFTERTLDRNRLVASSIQRNVNGLLEKIASPEVQIVIHVVVDTHHLSFISGIDDLSRSVSVRS